MSATAVKDASGQLVMTRGVAFDITEKRLLENALLDATNREQRRLGHDLHDGLGQVLTGISMLAAALARSEERAGRPLARELSHLEELTRKAVTTCRDIAHGLSPLSYAKGGLIEAIGQMVQAQRESFGTAIRFQAIADAPLRLSHAAQDHLYRIAQEAVTNARKHAQARSVTVLVDVQSESIRLDVRDDGSGLQSAEMAAGGMGLTIMRHRAAAIGARLSIGPGAEGGTRLSCECPQPSGTGLEGPGIAGPVAESVVRTERTH
jgi:two-component system CheB/CheR fusion protein